MRYRALVVTHFDVAPRPVGAHAGLPISSGQVPPGATKPKRVITCALTFAAAGLALLGVLLPPASSARERGSEDRLLTRIQKERNPVRKARYEMQLGRIKLLQAAEAYDRGHIERGAELLHSYAERMESSWQTLRDSGRNAVRQPQGFKQLEIALSEDTRTLEDLRHHVAYFDRGPVDKAATEIEEVRSEVLRALFPVAPRPVEKKSSSFGKSSRTG